ncbi:hypothetical protein HJG60_008909 [Phyllostomus discolor]|uniref:Uncharacterized protein n=1 Tax=Phyllostomus discolor TaxID=89673 RepID=A0A833YWR3_9CHIR|nr:hypothetical protein HJG60_008909 [Phyllostomus discolor]
MGKAALRKFTVDDTAEGQGRGASGDQLGRRLSKHPVQSPCPEVQRGGCCKLTPCSGPPCPPHPVRHQLSGPAFSACGCPDLRECPLAAAPVASRGGRTFPWPCFPAAVAPPKGSQSPSSSPRASAFGQRRSRDGRWDLPRPVRAG